jgi:DNA-binding response OmpR family regulator
MGKKILVVDDEPRVLDILTKFLSREGFGVLTAADGETALRLAREFLPDLILLDVMMPDMDGGQVMAEILADGRLKDVPVIFLTGAVSEEEAVIRNEAGTGHSYMSKAGDIREQVQAIRDLLGV